MAFHDAIRTAWNSNQLVSALVELTYACNLNCWFCYNDLSLKGRPLDTSQYLDFFRDLQQLGALNLILTGGEPLAHPHFFELGRAARDLGFVVRVKSNGHALGPRLSKRLKEEVDPFVVEVSLHGANPDTHDRQTGVPGSHKRLLENIRAMRDQGLRVKANSTLTRWNEDELESMYAIADELGISLRVDPEVTARDDGDKSPLKITASDDGIRNLYRVMLDRSQKSKPTATLKARFDNMPPVSTDHHCGAGSSAIAVNPFGEVYPCVQYRRSIGNLHQQSIVDIWRGSPALEEIREITKQVKSKVDREGIIGHCPGAAHTATGDPLAIHPASRVRTRLMGEIREEEPVRS